jgi:hypothetical protein
MNTRTRVKRGVARAVAVLLAATAFTALGASTASARWHIHNDADVTLITPPPGGNETQTCTDTLRGKSGWNEAVDDPRTVTPPPYAFHSVPYEIYQASVGAQPGGFIESPDDVHVDYMNPDGTIVPAFLIVDFDSGPRSLLVPPQPIDPPVSGQPNNYVFTAGNFTVALPGSVVPGSFLGVKPANGGSDFVTLTAVACTSARVDVLPGVRHNYVLPRLRAPLLPVLVYGSPALSVRAITSVHLQKAAPGLVPGFLTRPFDADHDGYLDRVYWFSPAATGITCGQRSVTMTGSTSSGTHFSGTDAIRTVC